jgi:hypothetical protein
MSLSKFKIKKGTNLDPQATGSNSATGDLEVLQSDGKLYYHNGITNSALTTESGSNVLTNKIIDADLNTITNIENADIKASANITRSKLAVGVANRIVINADTTGVMSDLPAITASRALASDANGLPVAATTTATELDYVSGVTSSIQTQLNSKQASGNYISDLTGDVTASGPGSVAATIANDAVTNAKMTNMAQSTIKGRAVSAGTGDPTDLTAAQATAILDVMVGDSGSGGTKGLVPAPASGDAGKVLTGAGTYVSVATNPMTTAGDIIYGGIAGAPTRLAQGVNGQSLVSGASAAAPKYQWGSVNSVSNAGYTVTATDGYDTIVVSTGASDRTVTLPDVASSTGRQLRIVKSDSGAGFVILDGNASETINGQLTRSIYGQYGEMFLYCDGTTWFVISENQPTWIAYTPTFVGFGTASNIEFHWKKDGSDIIVKGRFTSGTSTATEARIPLPASLSSSADSFTKLAGVGVTSVAQSIISVLAAPSTTYFVLGLQSNAGDAGLTARNGSSIAASGTTVVINARVAITGF